ncbi:MAG: hypothetical protein ACTHOH_03300 [Lysobacteraceae bacterium]
MTDTLFRPEVTRARADAWLGTTRLPSPRIAWPMTALSCALLLCVALFLRFGHVTREAQASGVLVDATPSAPGAPALLAELRVAEDAIGDVAIGTPVVLRYPAFPFRRDGAHPGRVVAIDRGPLPSTGAAIPTWRVVVAADPPRAGERALPLRPGMRVDAVLRLERRPLYEAVFFPARRTSHAGRGA